MSSRVPLNTATAYGRAIAEYVDALLETRAKGQRLADALNSMAQGGSFSVVDTEVNAAADPVRGELVYNLVTGSVSALNVAAINELVRIDQG